MLCLLWLVAFRKIFSNSESFDNQYNLCVVFFIDNSGDKLELNRGLFVGICLSIFIFGIFIGGVIAILVCKVSRRKPKTSKCNLFLWVLTLS